ncbi:restriction endonuclease subunit S [Phocaeicola vulgatus]|uniref:restriction endonuclease subunit S n=1 Tax=Phocaeicola vulgatus TaxID=821 RepID=UPI001EED442F|nr:restriction endonuclease subunit S [Phocaeicola vulgatus]MCG0152628.1 restriction endonuclease subunit S [Phocaeicola vulgatus]
MRFPEFTEEWVNVSLKDVADFQKERISSGLLDESTYISTENILQNFQGVQSAISIPANTNVVAYKKNDILLSNIRPYLKKVWFSDRIGGCSADVFVLRSKTCEPEFLYNVIASDKFINYVMSGAKGVKMPRGDKNQMESFSFSIPAVVEQRKISRLFQLLDERIVTQNKIIEKLQSLIKGLSQQLLSSENDWILYRLDDLAQIKSGYSGTQVSYQTPYKVSRIETISKHCIDIQRIGYVECIPESYRLNVGNILFSNINSIQYIGNTAYLDKDYGLYHGMNLLRIIPNTTIVRPRFLHLLLCTDWAINYFQTICNKAVSQASINQTALGKSRFPIPPMSVQQQICSMFELTERKLDNEQEYISCLQQQKRYLLQKMFI